MRTCSACHKEDKPWFESHPCSCGAYVVHDDDPNPLKHRPDCKSLGHEVVEYPVRIPKSDLTFDGKLSSYYAERGWALMRNGERYYRVKMLCRGCIVKETEALARKTDYEKACKAAQGIETLSYAQMIAGQ